MRGGFRVYSRPGDETGGLEGQEGGGVFRSELRKRESSLLKECGQGQDAFFVDRGEGFLGGLLALDPRWGLGEDVVDHFRAPLSVVGGG